MARPKKNQQEQTLRIEDYNGNKPPQAIAVEEAVLGAMLLEADPVMFIHRPEAMGSQDEHSLPGETDLIIAKHRNGETCDVKMRFLASEMRYVDYDDVAYGPSDRVTLSESVMNRWSRDGHPEQGDE